MKGLGSLANMGRLVFRQLFEKLSNTYTYVLGCPITREAVIIDPVIETLDRDINIVAQLELKLKYALNTHVHADHVTGTGLMKARLPGLQSVLSKASGGKADLLLEPGQILKFGDFELEMRPTPGHTNGCSTYVVHSEEMAFTGDALLIRGCGRTDFQQGCPARLFQSVHSQIFTLPKHFLLYPAHDYKGMTVTTVEEETKYNPRLTKSEAEFVEIMNNLGLAYPKQIDKSLPANLVCGILEDMPEATRKEVEACLTSYEFDKK